MVQFKKPVIPQRRKAAKKTGDFFIFLAPLRLCGKLLIQTDALIDFKSQRGENTDDQADKWLIERHNASHGGATF
jgi:hypothetical protein